MAGDYDNMTGTIGLWRSNIVILIQPWQGQSGESRSAREDLRSPDSKLKLQMVDNEIDKLQFTGATLWKIINRTERFYSDKTRYTVDGSGIISLCLAVAVSCWLWTAGPAIINQTNATRMGSTNPGMVTNPLKYDPEFCGSTKIKTFKDYIPLKEMSFENVENNRVV